jgi:large subunit ribosomal protein L22
MSSLEAHHRFARITARKARYVADLVRGEDVNRALEILQHTARRGSFFVSRVLRSAIANATREGNVNANRLFIRELQVDSGPLLQGRFRYQPGPMGRALPIRKRTSHIHVVLAERADADSSKRAGADSSKKAGAASAKKAGAVTTERADAAPAEKSEGSGSAPEKPRKAKKTETEKGG